MKPTEYQQLGKLAQMATRQLTQPSAQRPPDSLGRPGGLFFLDAELPTLVLPDLHARFAMLEAALACKLPIGLTLEEALQQGKSQLLFLGDGLHSENAKRWKLIQRDFTLCDTEQESMQVEMASGFRTMALVMDLLVRFPNRVCFLKGNHENILDESDHGNRSCVKYALETPMVRAWLRQHAGEAFLETWSRFEKALPLVALGVSFGASHAQPMRAFHREEIIQGLGKDEVQIALTWSRPGNIQPQACAQTRRNLLGEQSETYWISGHQPIHGDLFVTDENLILLHNPEKQAGLWLDPKVPLIPQQAYLTF